MGVIQLLQRARDRFQQKSNRLLSCDQTGAPCTVTAEQRPGMIENVENSKRFCQGLGLAIQYPGPLAFQALKGRLGANVSHGFPSFARLGGKDACDSRLARRSWLSVMS